MFTWVFPNRGHGSCVPEINTVLLGLLFGAKLVNPGTD